MEFPEHLHPPMISICKSNALISIPYNTLVRSTLSFICLGFSCLSINHQQEYRLDLKVPLGKDLLLGPYFPHQCIILLEFCPTEWIFAFLLETHGVSKALLVWI